MRTKVYIAGPYSSSNHMDCFGNIRAGLQAAKDLMLAGYAPYCPFTDFLFHLMLYNKETLRVDDYFECSLEYLKGADAVLVLPGSESARGVQKGIELAKELDIDIFYSIDDLMKRQLTH